MDLREGSGNEYKGGLFGRPTEDDILNVVWVVDSNSLPFYRVREDIAGRMLDREME
jgi:hypothetical protein